MIRYREFAISTASLATLSLVSGCDPTSINGEWSGDAFITSNGTTYALPFSFDGDVTYTYDFLGSEIVVNTAYEEWTMDFDITVEKNEAELTRQQHKVYTYSYSYEGTVEYSVDVDWTFERGYGGAVTHMGTREFDIVMDLDSDDQTLLINGVAPEPEEEKEVPTTISAVLQCSTDGDNLHCFQGTTLIVFTKE